MTLRRRSTDVRQLGIVLSLLILGPLAACQLQQQGVIQNEDNLAAEGFIVRLADTAERQDMLHRLPANQFVRRDTGGAPLYVYADPVACSCLYVGNQQAYDQYVSNQQADQYGQAKMAALAFYDAAWNWDAWGPWEAEGPLGPIYGPGW
jgi:hypothetical protein